MKDTLAVLTKKNPDYDFSLLIAQKKRIKRINALYSCLTQYVRQGGELHVEQQNLTSGYEFKKETLLSKHQSFVVTS